MANNAPTSTDKRVEIEFHTADVAEMADKAVAVLSASNKIFSHGGRVVHVATLPMDVDDEKLTRTILTPTTTPILLDIVSRGILFRRPPEVVVDAQGRRKKTKGSPLQPPKSVMDAIVGRQGSGLSPISMASGNPILRKDGSIVQTNGYDRLSGVFIQLDAKFPVVPDSPTKADALASLAMLKGPFRGFPFVDPTDHAVVIASILTGVISFTLSAKPAVGVNSFVAATGKTMLVNTISIIVTGAPLRQINAAKASTETEKRIDGLLLEGNPIIGVDNISDRFGDDKLCTSVTSSRIGVRPLGTSNIAHVKAPLLFLNGNNLQPKGDFCRRMLCCTLDAGMDDPSSRNFDFSAQAEAAANRPALLVAALIILRAYQVAGSPHCGLKPVGSFEEWSRRVRDALVWLGEPDVATTINQVREGDPERRVLKDMLVGWQHVIGTEKVRTSEVISKAAKAVEIDPNDDKASDFLESIESVAGEPNGSISPNTLGAYFGRAARKNVAGRWIERSRLHGNYRWQLWLEE